MTRQRRVVVGRLWFQAGSPVTATLGTAGGAVGGSSVLVEVRDADGTAVISTPTTGNAHADLHGSAVRSGWHQVAVTGTDTPDSGLPFTLAVTYTSTQHLGEP